MTDTQVKIDAKLVKELREKSGAPMGDCLKALQEAKGDMEDAFVVLRKRGMASAAKKASRTTNEGAVGTYIHAGGKIGVLLELNCESDFVARTEDFQELLRDIAMHIAAVDPRFVSRDDVTAADLEREKDVYRAQAPSDAEAAAPAPYILKIARIPGGHTLLDNERRALTDLLTRAGDRSYRKYLPTLAESFPADASAMRPYAPPRVPSSGALPMAAPRLRPSARRVGSCSGTARAMLPSVSLP